MNVINVLYAPTSVEITLDIAVLVLEVQFVQNREA